MPIWDKLLGGGAGKLIETIGNTVDEFVTSDEERLKMREKLADQFIQYRTVVEQEVTKRHSADMMSDSWLSKNIRPMILLFSLGLFTFLSFSDGNIGEFEVKKAYVDLLGTIISLGLAFYFGSRGFEKVMKIRNGGKRGGKDGETDSK